MSDIYIDDWLKRINTDYYEMFIRAWIPFNAWYHRVYYNYENRITSDRDILFKIKNEQNPYKSKIINLLNGSNDESLEFKKHIEALNNKLNEITIPNEQNRISFKSLKLSDNSKKQHIQTFKRKTYKFEFLSTLPRTSKRFKCDIIRANQTTEAIIELHQCFSDELEENETYYALPERIQKLIRDGFEEINPSKTTSIISDTSTGLKISDTLIFKNNMGLVAQFIIELIYQLRCKIFHGEINPNQNYHEIYKQAYYIQKTLINSIN